MINLDLSEAQLFRILTAFFGKDNVIPRMSAFTVCSGELPEQLKLIHSDLEEWARSNKCLFTVIDDEGNPKMVVEFFSGFSDGIIDPTEVEHQKYLKPLLAARGIRYITISNDEFTEILDPDSSLDMVSFLKDKVLPAEETA